MKRGDQAVTVVDCALELAMASPKRPGRSLVAAKYLAKVVHTPAESNRAHRAGPRAPVPSPADIEQLADCIAAARKMPVVITGPAGQNPRDAAALARLRRRRALPAYPVGQHDATSGCPPTIRCSRARCRARRRTKPTWRSSSRRMREGGCRGRRRPARASCRSARTRSMRAIRCAASPPTCDDHRDCAFRAGSSGAGSGGPHRRPC